MPLEQSLVEATKHCLAQATPWLRGMGRATPRVRVLCDLSGKAAGKVSWQAGRLPLIRYNLAIARHQPDDFLKETVPHEVAHVLCHLVYPRARPHGPEWQDIMRNLGAAPKRCHSFEIPEATTIKRQRRWLYRCSCREHQLSSTRHYRVLRQESSYRCTSCGGPLHPDSSH
jgi:SprT protein